MSSCGRPCVPAEWSNRSLDLANVVCLSSQPGSREGRDVLERDSTRCPRLFASVFRIRRQDHLQSADVRRDVVQQ